VTRTLPVRAVISDFGGVLTTPLFNAFTAWQRNSGLSFERLGQAMADAGERAGFHPLYELEKGTITEAEFLRMLEAELEPGTSLSGMRDVYFDHLEPNPPMIEFMRSLRERGLRMALLTNNVREWEPQWRAMLPEIDEIFEVVVDSAFVGMRKPDPAIYRLTVEKLGGGLAAEECVFVDDVDVNCEAARSLGMSAVLYGSPEQAIAEIEAALGGAEGPG
jgi:putative hydrolase of the HAD superfamily